MITKCIICGSNINRNDKLRLIIKGGQFCSNKCSNQWIRRKEYRREKERNGGRRIDIRHHYQKLQQWFEVRGWLKFNDWEIGWCYSLKSTFCHIEFGGNGDDEIGLSIAIPPIAIWLHLNVPWRVMDRELRFSIHHCALWWNIWHPKHEWSNKTPRWRSGNLNFLGRAIYYSDETENQWVDIKVPLPEKVYLGKGKLYECYWKRKWWPFAFERRKRVEINMNEGQQIPIPGKGTEDAVYGITVGSDSIEEGIGKLVSSVLETRQQYGGNRDWSPVEGQLINENN